MKHHDDKRFRIANQEALIGVALVLINSNLEAPMVTILIIALVWGVVVFTYTGRVISDYLRILGISALLTVPVLVLAAGLVVMSIWLIIVTRDLSSELEFLWSLASKT